MNPRLFLSVFVCSCAMLAGADLDAVLSLMDEAGPKFTGMTADLTRVRYTKVLDESETEAASMKLRRQGREIQILMEFTKPDGKIVGLRGKTAEIYYPKLKTVQEYNLGQHKGMVDQFLLVGFGTTGRDLKANYGIKYAGEESVAGQKAHKLEMVPNSPQMKESIRKMEIWVSFDGSYPLQQRFVQPSGDYHLAIYSNVKINPPLAQQDLVLKLPKGVKREYPQK